MLTDPLVHAFETASVDPQRFRHREHLYVAWCYLSALPFEEAAQRYHHHLRRLAAALGVPEKYHATITWAYLLLLAEVMAAPALAGADFETLERQAPALFDHRNGMLFDYYDRALLDSDEARRRFILPRRRPTSSAAQS